MDYSLLICKFEKITNYESINNDESCKYNEISIVINN